MAEKKDKTKKNVKKTASKKEIKAAPKKVAKVNKATSKVSKKETKVVSKSSSKEKGILEQIQNFFDDIENKLKNTSIGKSVKKFSLNLMKHKKRDIIAAVVSLIIPGLGQILKGHIKIAIYLWILMLVMSVSIVGLFFLWIPWLYNVYDAYKREIKW